MRRKLAVLVLTVGLAFALMPAMAAHAAASGAATLLGDTTVFPTATDPDSDDLRDGRRIFQIRITNTARAVSLGGLGTTISRARILFPPNVGDPQCGAMPGSWECVEFGATGAEGIALHGGTIMPDGGNAVFEFDGVVNAPQGSDRTERFLVQVADSGDDGFSTADGELDLTVRVLQTLAPISLTAGRDGTTFDADNRVTSGQPVQATYTVKNHAQTQLGVTANLAPADRTSLISFSDPGPFGGEEPATFAVDTTGVASGTTNVNLQSQASSPNATGDVISQALIIDGPVTLDVGGLNGGNSRRIAHGAGVNLQLTASKGNPPRVEPLTTEVELTLPGFRNETAVTASTVNNVAAGSSQYLVDFGNVPVGFDILSDCVQLGGTKDCPDLIPVDGRFTQTGSDSNGAAVAHTEVIPELLVIDLVAPFVTVEAVGEISEFPDRIREGDTLTFSGTVRDDPDSVLPPGDIDAASLVVQVGGNDATDVTYDTKTGDFAGTYEVPVSGDRDAPTFGTEGEVTVTASIADVAGNVAQADDVLVVDNADPFISPVVLQDHDGDPATEPVPQPLTYLVDGAPYGRQGHVVRAIFAPGGGGVISDLAKDPVAGGCSPTQWDVGDEFNVVEVLFWNGTSCHGRGTAPELDDTAPPGSSRNDRIIVIHENENEETDDDLGPEDLPLEVTYDPDRLLAEPTVDIVRNEAVFTVATLVDGMNPPVPNIIDFERVDVTPEDATPDGEFEDVGQGVVADGTSAYHFNTPQLRFTLDQVTIGDFLQIRDVTDGTLVGEVQMGANGEFTVTDQLLAELDEAFAPEANTTRVVELQYRREVGNGSVFSPQPLRIVLVHDTVNPALAPLSSEPVLVDNGDGTHDVDVSFTEELRSGGDDPFHWSALYRNPNRADRDNPWIAHLVNNVTSDPEDRTKRTLRIELNGPADIDAFEYEFIDVGGFRYEDLAGNLTPAQQWVQHFGIRPPRGGPGGPFS